MKLVTFTLSGETLPGFMPEPGAVTPARELGFSARDMNGLIDELGVRGLPRDVPAGAGIALDRVTLRSPLPNPRGDIICLGMNFRDHAGELEKTGAQTFSGGGDGEAAYFLKRARSTVGPGGTIDPHYNIVTQLDYECELAVVIGKRAYMVPPERAMEFVLGYTIMNDVSARNIQMRHRQWFFGKSLDGFTPLGPWIVTRDELPELDGLGIRTLVNGETRQSSTLGQMIFGVPYVISELSRGIALLPGDIIAMGTPSGVAMGEKPPRFLRPGDVVRCEIDGIGALENVIGPAFAAAAEN